MREVRRAGCIDSVPEFEPFKRTGRRQDVLSGEELTALFPRDPDELVRVWRRPEHMRKEQDAIPLMFGTLSCLTASAGLRSGEVRALHREQISVERSGLAIDRAIDDLGKVGPLKKATINDPRSRAVIIPDITMNMLERWMLIAPHTPGDPGLLFPYHGKPIASYYLIDRLRFIYQDVDSSEMGKH